MKKQNLQSRGQRHYTVLKFRFSFETFSCVHASLIFRQLMLVLDSERLTSIRCCQEWELVYRRKSLLLWLNASFLLFFVPKSCNSTQDLVRNRQRFMVVQRCTYFQVMFSYALPLSFSNFTLGKTKKKDRMLTEYTFLAFLQG